MKLKNTYRSQTLGNCVLWSRTEKIGPTRHYALEHNGTIVYESSVSVWDNEPSLEMAIIKKIAAKYS